MWPDEPDDDFEPDDYYEGDLEPDYEEEEPEPEKEYETDEEFGERMREQEAWEHEDQTQGDVLGLDDERPEF